MPTTTHLPNADDPLGLFGDGPPWWTINKGKLGERPSFNASETMKQRDETVFKLRWHAKHVTLVADNRRAMSLAALVLADKLDACAPPKRPCLSGACPTCMRAQQRWQVNDTVRVLRPLVRRGYRAQVLSLVPEFGRIPVGKLNEFEITKFLKTAHETLKACGIDHYKLGLDVSLNQRAGSTSPGFWQLQLWGFFHEPKRPWREKLIAILNPNEGVTRPVKVKRPDSLEAAAAYGVKFTFIRRVSYRKANLHREDCWNTRDRLLRGDAWVELMLFLDRIGLQRRILLSTINLSVAPLHSGNDLRHGWSKGPATVPPATTNDSQGNN
jgi:hypothetical protein